MTNFRYLLLFLLCHLLKRTDCVTWMERQDLNERLLSNYSTDVPPIENAVPPPPPVPPPPVPPTPVPSAHVPPPVYPADIAGVSTVTVAPVPTIPPGTLGSVDPVAGNVYIGVSMQLASLNDIDEMSGTMSTVAYFMLQWRDPRLTWDPEKYERLQTISLPKEKIWVPKILLANPVGKFSTIGYRDSEVEIYQNGGVHWKIGDYLQTACDIDITHFPFDRQTCAIEIVSSTPMREIKLFLTRDKIYTSLMGSNGAWTLLETSVHFRNDTGILSFKLHLERRSTFFVMNLFVPVVVLILLNSFVFILPADSGERTGFAITCMLAIAVFLTLVSETLPKTSKPLSVLSFILMLCMILSTCASIMTIISLYIHHQDETKPVPKFVQTFFSIKIGRCICGCCGRLKKSTKRLLSRISKTCRPRVREETKSVSSAIRFIIVGGAKNSTFDTTKNSPGDVRITRRVSSIHVENMGVTGEGGDTNSRCKDPEAVLASLKKICEIEPPKTLSNKEKQGDNEDMEEDVITWKIVAKKFDFFCFILVNGLAGALGTLYFMISSGRL